jgi:hypothetical protein
MSYNKIPLCNKYTASEEIQMAQKSVKWLVKCTPKYVRNFFYYLLNLQKLFEMRSSVFNTEFSTRTADSYPF